VTKQHDDYYTYAFLREDKTPYYIGKGRGKRIYSKNRLINPPKDKSLIIFLKKNLTEAEAFKHEIYMIFVLGRKDLGTGTLRNLTNGGEGASGHVKSEETRNKLSVANTGKIRTEEQKKRYSEAKSGIPLTKEHKKKLSVSKSGKNNPMFGVPRTQEWKKAMSEKKSGALNPCSKAIIAIKPDGTKLHFCTGREAARELGINKGNLCAMYLKTGNSPTRGKFKGWTFIYQN